MKTTIALTLCAGMLNAATIRVPADQPTIQAGIDASLSGDTVLVYPSTYVENVNFNGKNIVLASLFLTTGDTAYITSTIIDGDSSGTVITFENNEDSTAAISGFTVQNGLAYMFGGGILCSNSNTSITHNIIQGNHGIGIYCVNHSNASIANNVISGNTRSGIYCRYWSNPSISDNVITGNTEQGIHCRGGHPTIANNLISGNSSNERGGGICCIGYGSPTMIFPR